MSKIYTVYKAECKVDGSVYFGTTGQELKTRMAEHRSCVKRGSPMRFHEAMRLHGVDAFEFQEIAQCNNKAASWAAERAVIAEAMAAGLALLNTYDGQGCPKGTMPSRKAVEASVKALRGVKKTAEHKAKNRAAHTGTNNVSYDYTRHTFVHPIHGEIICTQNELWKTYKLASSHVCNLCNGKVGSAYGWRIKRAP